MLAAEKHFFHARNPMEINQPAKVATSYCDPIENDKSWGFGVFFFFLNK